jgi:hypothetical protein
MSKPVVLIAEELSPATIAVLGEQFEIRHCDGANRTELLSRLTRQLLTYDCKHNGFEVRIVSWFFGNWVKRSVL